MAGKRMVDLHEVMKHEVYTNNDDDLEYRMYIKNNNQRGISGFNIPAPGPTYVQTPTGHVTPGIFDRLNYQNDMNRLINNRKDQKYHIADKDKIIKKDEIGVEDHFLYFYSGVKNDTSDANRGLYIYDAVKLNDGFHIKNVIEAEITPFYIQNISVENYQPNYFIQNKLLIEMENIAGRQFGLGGDSKRNFHFECDIIDDGSGRKKIIPLNPKYTFTMPVRDIDIIKFRFKTPLNNVAFLDDVLWGTSVAGVGSRQFITDIPHGLLIGSVVDVYFTDYDSVNSNLNKIILNTIGHKVTVIDSNTIELSITPDANLIGTTLDPSGNLPRVRIHIFSREIIFNIRFRSIRTEITNFIGP